MLLDKVYALRNDIFKAREEGLFKSMQQSCSTDTVFTLRTKLHTQN